MKKSIAFLTALIMALSLTACNQSGDPSVTTANTSNANAQNTDKNTEAATEAPPPVQAEELPASPLHYYGFESADGLTSVKQTEDKGTLNGATYGIAASDHPILIAEGQGAVGNALYLDGKYGVDIDMSEIADDSYSISFWFNADRVATYGPVLQMGRNIGMSQDTHTVTWLNVTKTTWGTNSADIFPVLWNRNSSIGKEVSADGVWPWMYAMDDEQHGKREWCMLTVVVDGKRYVADDGMERVGTKFYLNGELKHEANAENMFYQGLAPEIFKGDGIEAHIGINYWDTIYKGFIDELYIYDEALTDGQVKTLFEKGNPPAKPVAPEYTPPEGEETEGQGTEPTPLGTAPVDSSAIDVLGTPERVLTFWGDTTDGYELADGKTLKMKLNNYSDAVNNWDNFVVAFSNTKVTTDKIASADNFPGYEEYGVLRADAFGWGPQGSPYEGKFEHSWGEDWAGWLQLMTSAKVEMTIARSGGTVTIDYTFTGADGTVMTEKATMTSSMTASSPVYVHLSGEGAYIELLSVE